MKKRWFRAKEYGWGWVPCSGEGWIATLLFAAGYAFLLISFMSWLGAAVRAHAVDYRGLSLGVLEFLASVALLTYVLVRICTRFGEKPRWRWGKK